MPLNPPWDGGGQLMIILMWLMKETLLQEGAGVPQAPQKPIRRKYHPENQSVETVPPSGTSFPTKAAQKLVEPCF